MLLTILKSKIQRVRITRAELYYQGSLTLDPALMRAAGMYASEMVQVVNLNNGTRLETYIIQGQPGEIGLRGLVTNGAVVLLLVVFMLLEASTFPDKLRAAWGAICSPPMLRKSPSPATTNKNKGLRDNS